MVIHLHLFVDVHFKHCVINNPVKVFEICHKMTSNELFELYRRVAAIL